ncbi:MAG: DivIVA domain-containing protein [Bacilli bacterium]|nr:DivIVA domain-containing protein [Bacilli bacterium]
MECKVKLTGQEIFDKKFKKGLKGYDADEVDKFLDAIIKDYLEFQRYKEALEEENRRLSGLLNSANISSAPLLQEKQKLQERVRELEIRNASLEKMFEGLKPGDKPTAENIEYIKKCNRLSDFLYSIGYNPDTLKKNDK